MAPATCQTDIPVWCFGKLSVVSIRSSLERYLSLVSAVGQLRLTSQTGIQHLQLVKKQRKKKFRTQSSILSELVGALSPVNHRGLHQGWSSTLFSDLPTLVQPTARKQVSQFNTPRFTTPVCSSVFHLSKSRINTSYSPAKTRVGVLSRFLRQPKDPDRDRVGKACLSRCGKSKTKRRNYTTIGRRHNAPAACLRWAGM